MKRSTLLATVAALALSTSLAAAQSSSTRPDATEKKQTNETTAPSRTNSNSSSQQDTQTQPAQRNTNSASQPSTSQGAQNQQQPQPAQRSTQGQQNQQGQQTQPVQRSTQGQQTQPSTSQTQNQPAQSNQQQTQSPAATQQPSTNQAAQPSGQQQQSGQAAATTPQQRTQITAAIQQQNVSPVRVNFAVNVGVAVPTSVRLAPLPTTIVSIVPQYRGYSYFVTEERIVIVEPRTHKIVEILPMEGRAAAAAPAKKVQFTREQRESIKKHATSKRTMTTGSSRRVTVEETIPADVELEEFSDVVVREVPSVRSYRYIRRDNDVYVVDPGSRRVIEVID